MGWLGGAEVSPDGGEVLTGVQRLGRERGGAHRLSSRTCLPTRGL